MAARDADAADPRTRLPLPGTQDELEDLGSAFNGLLDRLHEALERQRRFTGDASHQLRTPLTGLLSQVEVALRLERPPGEYQRVLKVVRAKGVQLRQIIESLLFLARAESESGAGARGHEPDKLGAGAPAGLVDRRAAEDSHAWRRMSRSRSGCAPTPPCYPNFWTTCWRTPAM